MFSNMTELVGLSQPDSWTIFSPKCFLDQPELTFNISTSQLQFIITQIQRETDHVACSENEELPPAPRRSYKFWYLLA